MSTKTTKAGRPAKWIGPTTPIRVPQHLVEHLLAIARELDSPEPNNIQNPNGLTICKLAADAATIAQGLVEGWISHKRPKSPQQMLTSVSPTGTYCLFLKPPRSYPQMPKRRQRNTAIAFSMASPKPIGSTCSPA